MINSTKNSANKADAENSNVKILIVERNATNSEASQILLGLSNFENIVIAKNIQEAAKLFSRIRFEIVILGIDFINNQQVELYNLARYFPPEKNFPIIAYADFETKAKSEDITEKLDDFQFRLRLLNEAQNIIFSKEKKKKNHCRNKKVEKKDEFNSILVKKNDTKIKKYMLNKPVIKFS